MPTKHRPARFVTAHGAWVWLLLVTACGGSDAERAKTHDGKPDTPTSSDDSRAPSPSAGDPQAPSPSVAVAANDAMTQAPFDATPSPDGKQVYYTALGRDESGDAVPGVFTVAASGGAISTLALGDPLTAPVNISVSLDGQTLFVADPAASAVFTLAASGGTPSPLAGTSGYAPRGLVVAKGEDKRQYLYFSGRAPDTQAAGVFRIDPAGGAVQTLASGAPFEDPAGVAVDAKGAVYVVEASTERASARVIRVEGDKPTTFVEGIGIGFPAGITLTRDDTTLLVSGLDPDSKRDVVYFVDVATQKISRFTKAVGEFHEPAGLHRAHDADVFAWADSQANENGTVYVLEP